MNAGKPSISPKSPVGAFLVLSIAPGCLRFGQRIPAGQVEAGIPVTHSKSCGGLHAANRSKPLRKTRITASSTVPKAQDMARQTHAGRRSEKEVEPPPSLKSLRSVFVRGKH